MKKFCGLFDDQDDVARQFEENLDDCEVLLAEYHYEDYSGSAYVLFKKDDQFFEVFGSHCSCYGLEGQWDWNDPVTLEQIHGIMEREVFDYSTYKNVPCTRYTTRNSHGEITYGDILDALEGVM